MNLNDFVVLPNNKAKSVKLNARNLQELQMETVTLAQESKEMEEKLQQLKESMSKEKEERGHSGGFRWKSGQCGSLNINALTTGAKKSKENRLQKLSAGKVKIRVLKDEPLTAPRRPTPPPPPPPPSPPPTTGLRTTRKSRLRGTYCGQCEIKTAGVMCPECTENYCIGCFTTFHQKGALKLHNMIPIQTDLQTHVSTRDVVRCFQNQINPSSHPSAFTTPNPSPNPNRTPTFTSNAITGEGDQRPEKGPEAAAKSMQLPPDPSRVSAVHHRELLRGEYNEEESTRSFQEALRQWRGEKSEGAGDPMSEDAMWTPTRPVSVSAMATQADLAPVRGAEGRGGGEGSVPVRVEFTEHSLTYMDRLLLKKHRRMPIETYRPSLAFGTDLKSPPKTNTGEETASLTAQEEDFLRYCASLFAVPVSSGRTEPQITKPESCLVIEVLDERDIHGAFASEQRTDDNREVPSAQQTLSYATLEPQTAVTSGGSVRVSCSSPSPAPPKPAQKLHLSKTRTSKSLSSKSKPSACPTDETPKTSRTSIKTPTSTSQKPNCPPNVYNSKPDYGSIQHVSSPSSAHSQREIPKSSPSPVSFPPDVSPFTRTRSPIPEEHLSPSPSMSSSLRSTFTVSPSSSTESTLLPNIYQSTLLQKGSDLSLLPEPPQSSQLFPQPISSLEISQLPPRQSQQSCCDPESLLSDNQLQLPRSPALSSSPTPPPKYVTPSPPVKKLSSVSVFNESPLHAYCSHESTLTEDSSVCMSSTDISGDHESTQDTRCIPPLPSHFSHGIQNPPLDVGMEEEEEEEELSIDSGDEMSSDSLGLAPHEEDSSDEEAQTHARLTSGRSGEEKRWNPASSQTEDLFVPEDADREEELQTDEREQPSDPSTVMRHQSAGSPSERFCDPEGFPPQGLDRTSGLSDTQEHTRCDPPLHTCRAPPRDSEPTGSEGYGPSRSLSTYTKEHLDSGLIKDNHTQPTGIQIHLTRPTRREEISANELGTSVCRSSVSDSTVKRASRRNICALAPVCR
ncbi:uncharacterized protein LOC115017749 [Cottoperca gobio]|uniref:Uncharacterized protein LOC115017749 n=1 Tax=Cottoperca gobio TaxID=56716 RepID=A0A6J2QYN5_COTGO|nr:zinc finger B-box domain-containing protein 1 [Cottoperca gobio]